MCRPLNEAAQLVVSRSQARASGRSMASRIVRAESWALSERVLEVEESLLLLAGDSAASPSISIDWFLAVLEAMGIR
eukprot:1697740-Pyramimonas_sp.AAC.1